jgi:hypothetical protein
MKIDSLLLRCTAFALGAFVLGFAFDAYALLFFGLTTVGFLLLVFVKDYSRPETGATSPALGSAGPAFRRQPSTLPYAA